MFARHPSPARRAAAGAFLFALAWGAACSRQTDVVAIVNGEAITAAELKRQVRVYQSVRPGSPDDLGTRKQVLDQVIKQRLLVQMARQAGLDKVPANQDAVRTRRVSLRADLERSIADAQAQLQGLDEAVEARTLIEALSQQKRTAMIITPKDLRSAYAARAAQSSLPPFVQVRDQLLEQLILDRLVEEARQGAKIDLNQEKLQ
jgi:LAS superfamily LD-carboxypeptidase LdcB